MLKFRNGVLHLICCVVLFTFPNRSSAQDSQSAHGPALYEATDLLVDYFAKDFESLTLKSKKTAIVNFSISENLPGSIREYVIKKIESAAKNYKQGPLILMQCIECLSLQAVSKGDEVFIKKGITDRKQLDQVMKRLGIRNHLDAHLTFTGSELVLQLSLVEADQKVSWAQEYRSQYRLQDSSPWMLGLSMQGSFFMKSSFPTPKVIRVYTGQRVYGLGNIGMALSMYEKTDQLDSIMEFDGFFELNHNEFFAKYWKHINLLYVAELGVVDFNSYLQLSLGLGARVKLGRYFHVSLITKGFTHVQKPQSDKPVYNPNGPSILNTNESLPPAVLFGVGFDIL